MASTRKNGRHEINERKQRQRKQGRKKDDSKVLHPLLCLEELGTPLMLKYVAGQNHETQRTFNDSRAAQIFLTGPFMITVPL